MKKFLTYFAIAAVAGGIGYGFRGSVDEDYLIAGGSHVNGVFQMPEAGTDEWKSVMEKAGAYCDIVMNASHNPPAECEEFFAARFVELQALLAASEKG